MEERKREEVYDHGYDEFGFPDTDTEEYTEVYEVEVTVYTYQYTCKHCGHVWQKESTSSTEKLVMSAKDMIIGDPTQIFGSREYRRTNRVVVNNKHEL